MKVVVLRHRHRPSQEEFYLLDSMCSIWRRQGHEIQEVCGLDRPLPAGDVAIQHVDLTVVPGEYREACGHFGTVINGAVHDISKSIFSRSMVGRADPHDGPVIIKTRNNYGGIIDWGLKRLDGGKPRPTAGGGKRRVKWSEKKRLRTYPIFQSKARVPEGVWRNENLIVEKFLPEVDADGRYNLRIWTFLGDREVHYRCVSDAPLVKSSNTLRREDLPLDEVPAELRDVRRRLGFDFGKFDYAMNEGQAVLYDVNKTPSAPENLRADAATLRKIGLLCEGLASFVGQRNQQ
jgi:hypothetical protein